MLVSSSSIRSDSVKLPDTKNDRWGTRNDRWDARNDMWLGFLQLINIGHGIDQV